MNLRDFKKDVEYVIGEFIEDCALYLYRGADKAADKVYALIDEACDLYNDLKDQSNIKVEGSQKAYFASLRKDLLEKTGDLYGKLSAVITEEKQ